MMPKFVYMPKFIYDSLPYLVTAIGAMSALVVYNVYAIICGIMLMFLALFIVHMRLDARGKRVDQLEDELKRERQASQRMRA